MSERRRCGVPDGGKRWLESDDVSDELRDLLRAAPVPRAMSSAERARSARALGRIAALPAAAGVMFWIKNVAIAGILGAAGGFAVSGAVVLSQDSPPPPVVEQKAEAKAPVVEAPKPIAAPEPPVAPVESEPPAPKRAVAPAAPSATAPEPEPVSPADSLAAETQKLEQARRALGTNPSQALALLDESQREFPKGKLASERELLTIDALGRVGRKQEAKLRAEGMLERHRGGLYEQRLRRILDTLH